MKAQRGGGGGFILLVIIVLVVASLSLASFQTKQVLTISLVKNNTFYAGGNSWNVEVSTENVTYLQFLNYSTKPPSINDGTISVLIQIQNSSMLLFNKTYYVSTLRAYEIHTYQPVIAGSYLNISIPSSAFQRSIQIGK